MSALPVTYDLAAYRGDSWAQTFRLLEGTDPVDLTGATVEATARARVGTHQYDLPVTLTDAAGGTITLSLPTGSVPYGDYDYDLEITNGNITTWVRGRLRVQRDVTNELP